MKSRKAQLYSPIKPIKCHPKVFSRPWNLVDRRSLLLAGADTPCFRNTLVTIRRGVSSSVTTVAIARPPRLRYRPSPILTCRRCRPWRTWMETTATCTVEAGVESRGTTSNGFWIPTWNVDRVFLAQFTRLIVGTIKRRWHPKQVRKGHSKMSSLHNWTLLLSNTISRIHCVGIPLRSKGCFIGLNAILYEFSTLLPTTHPSNFFFL